MKSSINLRYLSSKLGANVLMILVIIAFTSCDNDAGSGLGSWRTPDRTTGLRDVAISFVQFDFQTNGEVSVTEYGRLTTFDPSPIKLGRNIYKYDIEGSVITVGSNYVFHMSEDKNNMFSSKQSTIRNLIRCPKSNCLDLYVKRTKVE